jgi:hypothetical protein
MPSRFILFGFNGDNVARVASAIRDSLRIGLTRRESSFKGGEYFFMRDSSGMEISVERNVRDEDGDFAEPDFQEYGILVYVNYSTSRVEEKIAALAGVNLLRIDTI